MTGDIAEARKYKELIIQELRDEKILNSENEPRVIELLTKQSSDDLMRTYDAFSRFGAGVILELIGK